MELMHSTPCSRANSMPKLFRRRSTTATSGVGESLYGDDLEWDKSDFARNLPESDALSTYDVNEMAEILRNRFLEFDMASQAGGRNAPSRQSSFVSDALTPMANYDFTMEEFLKNNFVSPKLTFDIESLCENQILTRPFHRSLPDLTVKPMTQTVLLCKHLSLMDVTSIEWTFLKHATPRAFLLAKANHRTSYSHLPQSLEALPEPFPVDTKISVNYSRLSRLAMIRLYMAKLREKVCSFVMQTIQPARTTPMPVITEETIDTYDIIDE